MANPVPCQRCLESPQADYYWTLLSDTPWPFEQSTVALCIRCFLEATDQMRAGYVAALAELEAMQEGGHIDQALAAADQDAPEEAPRASKSRRKAPEPVPVPATQVAEEGAPPDDHR